MMLKLKKIGTTAILILGLTGGAVAAGLEYRAPASIIEAQNAYTSGNYRAVVQLSDKLPRLTKKVDRAAANMLLCQAFLQLSELTHALESCSDAAESDEFGWQALNNKAIAHFRMGNMDEARANFSAAKRMAPQGAAPAGNLEKLKAHIAAINEAIELAAN